jgi:tape measure domain-containing protein
MASPTIGTAYFRVAPNMSGVQSKISSGLRGTGSQFGDQFGKELGTKSSVIFGAIAGITQAATQKAINLISSSVSDAVKRVDILNNFPKVMSNMGIGFDDAAKASDKLDKGLRGLPTTLDTGTLAVQRLTTKTQDVSKATDIYLAFNNAVLAGGAPMELQATATEQFAQAFAKGKPDMMEWRSMLAAMPAQLQQVAKAMNLPSADALGAGLRDGSISMDEFAKSLVNLNKSGIDGLPSLAKQAKNATGGIGTSMAVMKTAITRGLADIMKAFGTANIADSLKTVGKAFETVLSGIATGIEFVARNKDVFGPIAAAIGAIVVAMTAWAAITKTMAIAQAILNAVMAANPIGLIILAVIGLVAALTYFFTKTELGKKIFQSFGDVLTAVWNGIVTGLTTVGNFFSSVFSKIKSVVGGVIGWIKSSWMLLLGILTGPIGLAVAYIIKNWDRIKSGAANVISSVVSFFSGLPGRILRAVGNLGSLLYNSGRNLIQGLLNGAGSLLSKIGSFFLDKVPGWIKTPFKKALGIASPSKVFAGFGENITQGLVNGINGNQNMVSNAAGNMTDSVLAGYTNPAFSPSMAFGGGSGVGTGAGSGNTTNRSVNIQKVVLGDETAVKEFFRQINRDTIYTDMGMTPNQGATA